MAYSRQQISAIINPRVQSLIILPTERCNFRCSYCYEDHAIGRMSESTIGAVERFLERRVASVGTLRLSWFGGEPLLHPAILLRLASHAKSLCEERGAKLLRGEVTTNGYLLSLPLAERLAAVNQCQFQISLDGWGSQHDCTRHLQGGRGTFERIWSNLLALRASELDLAVLVRVHLTRQNLESVGSLLANIASNLLGDSRFEVLLKPIDDLGGDCGSATSDLSLPVTERAAIINGLTSQLVEAVPDARDRVWHYGAGSRTFPCYAAAANHLIIRSDGRLAKCTVAMDDPRNTIGHLRQDGTIDVDQQSFRAWLHGIETGDEEGLNCPLQNLPPSPSNGREAQLIGTDVMPGAVATGQLA